VNRVSLSREPKSMILCESLTQRTHVSRVSLIITEICQQIKIIQLISCTNNICLEYIIDINMIILGM